MGKNGQRKATQLDEHVLFDILQPFSLKAKWGTRVEGSISKENSNWSHILTTKNN
jgi:hypothetical protein